ncbi:MAG: T9SS type A sorting domain-containing protein [Bacteroidota bacterium]
MLKSSTLPAKISLKFPVYGIAAFLFTLATAFLCPTKLSAQTWTGATNTDWSVNTNWSTNTVPDGNQDVIIPITPNNPIINYGTTALVKLVKVMSSAVLTINGDLTMFGSFADGITNQGILTNNGHIKIGNAVSFTTNGIYNTGIFSNYGLIEIAKMNNDGIFSQGLFNNYGIINIGTAGTVAQAGIENYGTFNNTDGAYISIDHAGYGIVHKSGTFTNTSIIDIGQMASNTWHIAHYGIQNKGAFVNTATAIIRVDRSKGPCLSNEANTFNNAGTLKFATNFLASQSEFSNNTGATIFNDHCAVLEGTSYIFNKGTITNLGFVKVNNVGGGNQPHENTGTITNDGVIDFIAGDPIPNIVNHDMLLAPNSGECTMPNALQLGNALSFSAAATWYYYDDLTSPLAAYNQATNTLTNIDLNFGVNTAYFVVTDNNYGCSYTVSKQVTLLPDHTAPTVTCKSTSVAVNAGGTATLDPALLLQDASDDCGGYMVNSATPNTFNCTQIGQVVSATLTISDYSGNTATCTGNVKVLDLLAPTMLCKNIAINLDASGNAAISPSQINNGSSDNCSLVSMSLSQTTFSCANLGSNSVLLFGADQSDNKGSCAAVVTVRDVTPPKAFCKNASVQLDAAGSVTLSPAAFDNGSTDICGIQTMSVTPATMNCGNLGTNTVTLKVTDLGNNTATCTAIVTVRDQTAPTPLCKNINVFLDDLGHATITAANVDGGSTDACGIVSRSINLNQFDCAQIGGTPVSIQLTVKDQSNNQASCIAKVTVKDNMAPTAVCEAVTVNLNAQGKAIVYGANLAGSSFDNCSVWSYSPVAKTYTTANIGVNNLAITVKDFSGNAATCTAQVTVKPYQGIQKPSDRGDKAENLGLDLNLFPNPASEAVNAQFQLSENEEYRIRVFDLTGKMVLQQIQTGIEGANQSILDIHTLASGNYVLQFQSGELVVVEKLVVVRD